MNDLIYSYAVSQTIRAFAELRIAEHLAGGGASARDLAARTGASTPQIVRLLRAGAALGLTVYGSDGVFSGTDLLGTLREDDPRSLRSQALSFTSTAMWTAWTQFVSSVRTGSSQAHQALGEDFFAYLAHHPKDAAAFSAAMSEATGLWSDNIAEVIDTTSAERAVDVGGAAGTLLRLLQTSNPALRGVVFDRAEVADHARTAIENRGFPDRTDFVAGDFFTSVPPGDLYLLKFILHDWDDRHCIQILRRCRQAMLPGGRVVVVDFVWNDANPSQTVAMSDMSMMLLNSGRERSLAEFDALLTAAGLRMVSVRPTRGPQAVIEAVLT
jgi:hypothetical protein